MDFDLANKNLTSEQLLEVLQKVSSCESKVRLKLSSNRLGDSCVAHLSQGLKSLTNLVSLDVSGNNLSDMGCIRLATALQANTGLYLLDLSDNLFRDRGLQALIRSLTNYPRKNAFDLLIRNIQFSDTTALALLNLLKEPSPGALLRIGMLNPSSFLSPFYCTNLAPYFIESQRTLNPSPNSTLAPSDLSTVKLSKTTVFESLKVEESQITPSGGLSSAQFLSTPPNALVLSKQPEPPKRPPMLSMDVSSNPADSLPIVKISSVKSSKPEILETRKPEECPITPNGRLYLSTEATVSPQISKTPNTSFSKVEPQAIVKSLEQSSSSSISVDGSPSSYRIVPAPVTSPDTSTALSNSPDRRVGDTSVNILRKSKTPDSSSSIPFLKTADDQLTFFGEKIEDKLGGKIQIKQGANTSLQQESQVENTVSVMLDSSSMTTERRNISIRRKDDVHNQSKNKSDERTQNSEQAQACLTEASNEESANYKKDVQLQPRELASKQLVIDAEYFRTKPPVADLHSPAISTVSKSASV